MEEEASHFMVDSKQRETGRDPGHDRAVKDICPCDLHPPARIYLLRFPDPLNIAPPAGDHTLNT